MTPGHTHVPAGWVAVAGPERNPLGNHIYFRDSTRSTMDDADAYIESVPAESRGSCHGAVFVADLQLEGRGRVEGRRWQSAAGDSLLFTVCLRADPRSKIRERVAFIAAVALCRVLEEDFSLAPLVHWPNDVLLGGRKVAGILGECKGEWIRLGMGVNLLQQDFTNEISNKASSLAIELVRAGREDVFGPWRSLEGRISFLERILRRLGEGLMDTAWRAALSFRLAGKGERVLVRELWSNSAHKGTMLGLAEDGRLRVRLDSDSEVLFSSGEVSVLVEGENKA